MDFDRYFFIIGILCCLSCVRAWDSDDLEVFDVVEEVNKNFYQVLDVPQDSSQAAIRKAYRRLSLQLHPDHNKDKDADDQFRQLVAIYEILKDEVKRQKYDHVLKVGLPDWKQPIYYYRRVRKFGIVELAIILFGIITVGQYIVAWSVYLERKYTIEGTLSAKLKRKDRRLKKDELIKSKIEEEISLIQKPKYIDLLPFLIVRSLLSIVCGLPAWYATLRTGLDDVLQQAKAVPRHDNEPEAEDGEPQPKPRRRRRYIQEQFPEDDDEDEDDSGQDDLSDPEPGPKSKVYVNRTWFDDDIAALTRLMVKYPVGTSARWELIGNQLNRPVNDVIRFAKTLSKVEPRKVDASLQGLKADSFCDSTSALLADVEVTRRYDDFDKAPADQWSQEQQKALEAALLTFPKGTEERWEKISVLVPDKTKEECIARFKEIVEMVKKKRLTVVDR